MPKRTKEATVDWKLSVPVRIATMVEELTWNRVLGKPGYASRSRYVVELIERDLASKGLFSLADVVRHMEERK